jgi:hypothetical protein
METRRGLLKKTFAGTVLLATAAAVPVALRRTRVGITPKGLLFFTAEEYAIWSAVSARILATDVTSSSQDPAQTAAPIGAPTGPSPAEVDVAAKADAFLGPLPEGDRKDLKQLLALFDNALFSAVSGGPARPFTAMSAVEQDQHLRAWETSRLSVKRTGFQAVKRLCCAVYFSDPRTFASVGYPGPPVELVRSAIGARR